MVPNEEEGDVCECCGRDVPPGGGRIVTEQQFRQAKIMHEHIALAHPEEAALYGITDSDVSRTCARKQRRSLYGFQNPQLPKRPKEPPFEPQGRPPPRQSPEADPWSATFANNAERKLTAMEQRDFQAWESAKFRDRLRASELSNAVPTPSEPSNVQQQAMQIEQTDDEHSTTSLKDS